MNREEIVHQVTAVISAVLKRPLDAAADISREGLSSWDSLKHIEIMLAIEEAFDLQFTEQEFSELYSLHALVDAVLVRDAT